MIDRCIEFDDGRVGGLPVSRTLAESESGVLLLSVAHC